MSSDGVALLDLWETMHRRPATERAVTLAAAVEPVVDPSELLEESIGNRDARLATFHRDAIAAAIDATAQCPACDDTVEFEVSIDQLLDTNGRRASIEPLVIDGVEVVWRPPTSSDLIAAASATNAEDAAESIYRACVQSAPASDAVRAAVAEAIAAADPLAEVIVGLECPECAENFSAEVDVSRHALLGFERQVRSLLRDVDILATRYGWTEAEVLAVPDKRREAYLAMADSS